MFKSTQEFDNCTYDVLKSINDEMSIDDISRKYKEFEFDDIIEHCYNRGYITGTDITKSAMGNVFLQGNPRLTRSGLDFIEKFNNNN